MGQPLPAGRGQASAGTHARAVVHCGSLLCGLSLCALFWLFAFGSIQMVHPSGEPARHRSCVCSSTACLSAGKPLPALSTHHVTHHVIPEDTLRPRTLLWYSPRHAHAMYGKKVRAVEASELAHVLVSDPP